MTRMISIDGRRIGPGEPVFVIAEAGFNHNGSLDLALRLVDAAADAGADAIKFQSFTPDRLLHSSVDYKHFFEAAYLPPEAYTAIVERAEKKGIFFGSTAFDPEWVRVLDACDVAFLKAASMDLTTPSLLEAMAETGRPVILSTGLSTLEEVAEGVRIVESAGAEDIAILHCISLYPTPIERLNLRVMRTMEDRFLRPVGFSDHTKGDAAPVSAVYAGASLIEKHFTVDKSLPGPDQAESMDPVEFRKMIERIRFAEVACGSGVKEPCAEELPLREKTRRGIIVTADVIRKGTAITRDMLDFVRPVLEGGVPAAALYDICGKTSTCDLKRGDVLHWKDVDASNKKKSSF